MQILISVEEVARLVIRVDSLVEEMNDSPFDENANEKLRYSAEF